MSPNAPLERGRPLDLDERRLRCGRLRIYVASFAMDAAAFCFFVYLSVHAQQALGADEGGSGWLGTAVMGSLTAACFLSGWLLARFSGFALHLVGALWIPAVAVPLAAFTTGYEAQLAAGSLFGIGLGLYWPSLEKHLALASASETLWRVLGSFNLSWAAGICVGSLGGSSLYDLLGRDWSLAISALFATVAFATLVWPALPQHPRVRRIDRSDPPEEDIDATTARAFRHLGWVANFAAVFSLHAIIFLLPHVCERIGASLQSLAWMLFGMNLSRWLSFLWLRTTGGWHFSLPMVVSLQGAAILGLGVVAFVDTAWPLFVALPLLGWFGGLAYYSSLFYGLRVPRSEGKHSSLHEGILSLAMTVGPLICGVVAQAIGDWPSVVFLVTAMLLLLALVLEIGLVRIGGSGSTSRLRSSER